MDARSDEERAEVVVIGADDVLAGLGGEEREVGVDHIGGSRDREEAADRTSVVEGVEGQGVEEASEVGLARTASPHLAQDRM